MRHPARIQAAIELLNAIEQSLAEGGASADVIIKAYFRARRYAGSKDRAAVAELVYGVLRQRAELLWCLQDGVEPGTALNGRAMMIVWLTRKSAMTIDRLGEIFDGSAYAPEPLDAEERALVASLPAAAMLPEWVTCQCPAWLIGKLQARFGTGIAAEFAAMNDRAPLDIRVNTQIAAVAEVAEGLAQAGFTAERLKYAPAGFRLPNGTPVTQLPVMLSGQIEIQDEAAQVASALSMARSPNTVVDLCAGAGGKALAMASLMTGDGQVYAFDTVERRLFELIARAKRARAANIQTLCLPEAGPDRAALVEEFKGETDLVVLDVPCSGTGTWRRNPEARWRLTPARLDKYLEIQAGLLEEGAALVQKNGMLAYMTCSLLREENEAQILAFLTAHKEFQVVPYRDLWPEEGAQAAPETLSSQPECLCLSPGSHGTDGFFMAFMQRI